MREKMIEHDAQMVQSLVDGKATERKDNPWRYRYIHLLNLQTLFEFCIPVIQDYGVALKGNDYERYVVAITRLYLFYVICESKGSWDYKRSLFCCMLLLRYWHQEGLPVMELLQANHTAFSEESGEIALSVLATHEHRGVRGILDQTRKQWQFVRQRFDLNSMEETRKKKKFRYLSKSLVAFPFEKGGKIFFLFFPTFRLVQFMLTCFVYVVCRA
jgi:hypothetical protein